MQLTFSELSERLDSLLQVDLGADVICTNEKQQLRQGDELTITSCPGCSESLSSPPFQSRASDPTPAALEQVLSLRNMSSSGHIPSVGVR